ncbi:TPA: hypothetical protein DIU22_03685 [Candidatus Woesebacteria bacterium]|nr:hypothetical protein [Candidatus Woesebacteria bacterium]
MKETWKERFDEKFTEVWVGSGIDYKKEDDDFYYIEKRIGEFLQTELSALAKKMIETLKEYQTANGQWVKDDILKAQKEVLKNY